MWRYKKTLITHCRRNIKMKRKENSECKSNGKKERKYAHKEHTRLDKHNCCRCARHQHLNVVTDTNAFLSSAGNVGTCIFTRTFRGAFWVTMSRMDERFGVTLTMQMLFSIITQGLDDCMAFDVLKSTTPQQTPTSSQGAHTG